MLVTALSFSLLLFGASVNARKCPARHYSIARNNATSVESKQTTPAPSTSAPSYNGCFPSANFDMPSSVPSTLENWWCDMSTQYAFVGFSYSVAGCQSRDTLTREFSRARKMGGRAIRIYGACDRDGFNNDLIEAAWSAGVEVHALIWFGFDGSAIYKTRRDTLLKDLLKNNKAAFVIRAIQFGSEPLYDRAIEAAALAVEVRNLKKKLSDGGKPSIDVYVSDLAYGFKLRPEGSKDVMNAINIMGMHALPFFDPRATTGANAWPIVEQDIRYFQQNGKGKKLFLTQCGWPSVQSSNVRANSGAAIASVASEKAFYDLLDSKCSYFKQEGIAYFAHLIMESQGAGYGIIGNDGNLKFPFNPRTSC